MFRCKLKYGFWLGGLLPTEIRRSLSADVVTGETATEKKTDFSVIKNETGWDRVKRIFRTDEFGGFSMELNTIFQASCMSMFIGALYGGFINSKTAYVDFMRNNQATTFRSHVDAKRQLQDAVVRSFGKGAFKWGWRLSVFTTSFVTVSTIIGNYRGKSSIIEYVGAGAASGFLYKFKEGPKAWVVGSGLGAVLGLMAGGATLTILHLTGISMEEARYWQYYWYDQRNAAFRKGIETMLDRENLAAIREHNQIVGDAGKELDNIDKPMPQQRVTESS